MRKTWFLLEKKIYLLNWLAQPLSTTVIVQSQLMPGQTSRYFCLLKCSLCQIRWLKSQNFFPCRSRETWQTTRCSLINHLLQFMTCMTSPTRKRLPLTTTTIDKPSWEVNKKSNMLFCCFQLAVTSAMNSSSQDCTCCHNNAVERQYPYHEA